MITNSYNTAMSMNSENLKKREYRSFSGGKNESHPALRLVRELACSKYKHFLVGLKYTHTLMGYFIDVYTPSWNI